MISDNPNSDSGSIPPAAGEPPLVAGTGTGPAAASPKPPRRKRGWILKLILLLIVLVVLLIALAPTILSTSPVVSMILGRVNQQLNGKITVESLSLGWLSGVDIKGVRVFDDQIAQIAELKHVAIPLPLWKAAFGNYALGNVVIEGLNFDARIDADGRSNFQKLGKSTPPQSGPPTPVPASKSPPVASADAKPSKVPNVSGDIKITDCRGTVSQAGRPTLYLTKLDGEVKIPDINQPITDTLALVFKVGDQPEGTINLNGTASAIKSNHVALDTAEIHQSLDVSNLSLAAAKPFLSPDKIETLEGILAAHAAVDVTAGQTAVLDVLLTGKQKISVGGKALKGNTFSTNAFTAAIPKLTGQFPDGLGKWQSGQIKVGGETGSTPILLQIDQGQLTVLIDTKAAALLNLQQNKKPGSAGNLTLADHLDIGALARQLPGLFNVSKGVKVTGGTLAQNVKAEWTADKATLSATTDVSEVKGERTTTATTGTPAAATPISLAPIHLAIEGADLGGETALPDLHDLKLALQSKFATADFNGTTLAALSGKFHADLKVLQDEIGQLIDLSNLAMNGTLDADLSETGQLNAAPYKSKLGMNLTGKNLRVGKNVNFQALQVALTGDLQGSEKALLESIQNFLITVKTGDGTAAPADALIVSANAVLSPSSKSLLEYVTTAHAQIDVPSVQQTMKLVDSLSPPVEPAPVPAAADAKNATPPVPPKQWDAGSATIVLDLSHAGSDLKNVLDVSAKGLAFHRGDVSYQFKPITVKLGATVTETTGEKLMDQIAKLQVTDLTGDLGIATLSMPTPITVTDLATSPQANGGVKMVGSVADLSTFLCAWQGKKPDALPYRGDYTLTENVVSKSGTIGLQGGIDIAKLQAYNGNAVTFSEDLFSIANDVSYMKTADDSAVQITNLSATMKSSGAMSLALANGSVQKLATDRVLQLQPKLSYDLAKLWPVIQPMMGDSYKTMKITGAYQKQFNVTGKYPANEPMTTAIKTVKADGDLAVDSLDYNGLSVRNFILPVTLADGKLVTVYTDKPAGQNTAPAAVANDGALDVSNLTIDMTQDPPRLNIPANKTVLSKVTINPLFADTFLKNIVNNPLFTTPNAATGLVDLVITDCTELPLGKLLNEAVPENTGKIDLLVSITKLNISIGSPDLAKYLGNGSFEANVNNGAVSVAKGITTQHINFVTGSYTLSFNGSVRLKDKAFIPMTLGFPLKTVATKTGLAKDERIAAMLPEELSVPVEGTVSKPRYRFDQTVGKAITDATGKAITGGLLGGNKNGDGKGNSNPLGGLFDKITNKKNDKPADPNQNTPQKQGGQKKKKNPANNQ